MKNEATETPDRADVMFIATDLSTGGGVNKVIGHLADLFTRRLGLSVKIVSARSDRKPTYPLTDQVAIEYHRKQSLLAYFLLLLRLRRTRPAVVVGPWTQDNILMILAFLFSRTKVIVVEHASWHFQSRPVRLLRRIVYPAAWRVVVLNPAELVHYRKYLDNLSLIPNPVPDTAGTEPGPRQKLVVAIGHLKPEKGFDGAIRAMAASELEKEDWSLAVIGKGDDEERLRRLIDELGLQRTSIYPPTKDVRSWYRRASIILLTSRLEVFSLVLAEAMQSGVIPIAYATDGPSFILEDFPAHLVEVGDVNQLTSRLSQFARDPDLDRLRGQFHASIARRFSPDIVVEQWQRLLS